MCKRYFKNIYEQGSRVNNYSSARLLIALLRIVAPKGLGVFQNVTLSILRDLQVSNRQAADISGCCLLVERAEVSELNVDLSVDLEEVVKIL